jgi:cytochrome c oxidase subunit II
MTKKIMQATAAAIVLMGWGLAAFAQDPGKNGTGATRVIEVTAKKYELSPDEIHVKKGEKVRLKVHSTDEDHGIKLELYPEGNKNHSTPGLVFDNLPDNGKLEKGKDQTLDFVAQQIGTYEFKCAKMCGVHHGRMKGKLIVEE